LVTEAALSTRPWLGCPGMPENDPSGPRRPVVWLLCNRS